MMLEKSISKMTIVVRIPNWVGDVCMVMPTLAWLASAGHRMIVCGKPFARPFVESLRQHNTSVTFIPITGSILPDVRTIRSEIRRRRDNNGDRGPYSGLLFPDSLTSALTFWLSGIQSLGHRDDGRSILLRWPVEKSDHQMHAVLKWYRLARLAASKWALGLPEPYPVEPPDYTYSPDAEDKRLVSAALDKRGLSEQPFVLIAPTATGLHKGRIKVWPGFNELTQNLLASGYQVVACPPAHELEQARLAAPGATVMEPLSLSAFSELARLASLVVCNDSGVSHVAAMVGARQLTLFGVTDPLETGPWNTHAVLMGEMGRWPSTASVTETCLKLLSTACVDPHKIAGVF